MEETNDKKLDLTPADGKGFLPMPGDPPSQQIPVFQPGKIVADEPYKKTKLQLINEARAIIRGQRNLTIAELNTLIDNLEREDQFAYATEVLLIRMKMDEEKGQTITDKDYEKLARYIYQDHSLPSSFKFEKALQELGSHEDLSTTRRCETLGLAGAIYKRKWQFDHQFANLTLSRFYYQRGFDKWKDFIKKYNDLDKRDDENDEGYNAINYAYISDLMAVEKLEEHGKITGATETVLQLSHEAAVSRLYILKQFVENDDDGNSRLKRSDYSPWVIATVAEAFFGLAKYGQSKKFIQQYLELKTINRWTKRSFSQQMFSLAYLQHFALAFSNAYTEKVDSISPELQEVIGRIDNDQINACLLLIKKEEQENDEDAKSSSQRVEPVEIKKQGKLGLGLSGGGFRAALFHIGVLAALAEKDELKNVEVISCVSGGSIIGAYYYLKLKKLLESKSDDDITREDYIKIIKEIEQEFVKDIQHNLRMLIFSNLVSGFKMLKKDYSRTHRLGELYEKYLYKKLVNTQRSDAEKRSGKKDDEIYMSDLFIHPKGVSSGFSISIDNWKRKNKIPQLVLNATSINTGHNFQFTASWMGEPPGNIQSDIDVKPRLRRMYYEEAPDGYKNFRLGYAVGASSCVPVMFEPMPMHDLYPGIELQLIDGGVHDNQGIGALLDQECINMIISDGSGQMGTEEVGIKNEASLFFRSDLILQERIRELQFMDIEQRNSTTQINRLYTLHLKSDLENAPISWKYCTDPPRKLVYSAMPDKENGLTRYGILYKVQLYLSQIRTDLDSFNNLESYALMYSGYEQMRFKYKMQEDGSLSGNDAVTWNFLNVKPYVTMPDRAAEKEKLFKVASRVPFKVYYLSKVIKIVVLLLAVAAGAFVFANVNPWNPEAWNYSIVNITAKAVVIAFLLFVIGLFSKVLANLLNIKSYVRHKITLIALVIFGWIVCNFYILFFNGLYNRYGELDDDTDGNKKK